MLWEPHGPQGRVSALVNFRSPACIFGELKEEVCQGSANSGRELLPPAQLIQGDICSSIMISLPQGSSQWFRQHHHSHPAGCSPEIVSPVGTVGRSRAGRSRPAFPALCTFTWIGPEVKSRCHQQGFLYSTRPTVPQGQHVPGASLLPGLIQKQSWLRLLRLLLSSSPSDHREHFLFHPGRTLLSRYKKNTETYYCFQLNDAEKQGKCPMSTALSTSPSPLVRRFIGGYVRCKCKQHHFP